jgi:predicted membrane chloride channel (bestrophin family)
MIIAFAVALKHRLRFEPYTQYKDLQDLVSHLDTFAKSAGAPMRREKQMHQLKRLGLLLQIPWARSNPRKEIKHATRPLGNLPMEILSYMSAYVHEITQNKTLASLQIQQHTLNNMQALNEIVAQTDRILNTPLPVAYSIAIAQITWIYIITLPFQLVQLMGWIAVPVTTVVAYIVFGMHAIGNEIENPFGPEVNDLPMEMYCSQIATDVTIISSRPSAKPHEYWQHPDNKPLYPISSAGYDFWASKSEYDIRSALYTRAAVSKSAMCKRQSTWRARDSTGFSNSVRGECGECDEDDGKEPVSPTSVD